ncbi:MAG: PD-(D/E)XK nuclease family transposase [Desulfovibrionaceae bacterium]|nr:PD-(D/E)XK nuclease family transposase [Desulfovibrionaceae bacterium]
MFDIAVPGPKGLVHIIVNIEMQKGKITYLLKREDYYTSRLVSRQKGTVFFHDNYKDIVQVYSIWILPQPYVDNKNAITAFRYLKDDIDGATIYTNDSRNINNIVLISLGDYEKATPGSLLGLLDLIFTSRIDQKEKFSKLTNEFGIRVTETIKKGFEKMYSYVDSIAEDWAIDKAAEKIADVENYYRKIIDDWKMKEQGWEKKEQGWEKERADLKKANDELHNQVAMLENKIKEMLKIKN